MNHKTIAMLVVGIAFNAKALTLEGGYAITDGGKRVHFEPAQIVKQKRAPDGRCTYALAKFSDGSKVEFRWNAKDRAPTYRSMS
jgi:hypothetical protein